MLKKTLVAVAISASLFSVEALANTNNTRANGAVSESTLPSVGHRPIAVTTGKSLSVSGKLVTGEKLTIDKIFITDADGDTGDDAGTAGEASLSKTDVKWYLVKGNAAPVLLTDTDNNDKTMTLPADTAGGKIEVAYTVKTLTGVPDVAKEEARVTLTPANSGVTVPPGGNVDGTVSAKLAGVTIEVTNVKTPTPDINGEGVTADTPVVGATLEAKLDCAAESNCSVGEYNFKWSMADAGTTAFSEITPVGTEAHKHIIQGNQQNKIFKVEVSPITTKSDAPVQKAKRR